jgi:hypothetical protein
MTDQRRDYARAAAQERHPEPHRVRSSHPPRCRADDQHRVISANFDVRCRECGVGIEHLHVQELVVYCAACCPACRSEAA